MTQIITVAHDAATTFADPLPVTPASLPTARLLDQLGQPQLLRSTFNVVG